MTDEKDDATRRQRVTLERQRRGWSVRHAAAVASAAGARISNTTWGSYEAGRAELSGPIQAAIAAAYDWPADWPSRLPPLPVDDPSIDAKLDRLLEAVSDGPENVAGVAREVLATVGQIRRNQTELAAAIEAIARRLKGEPPPAAKRNNPHRSRHSGGA